MPYIDRSLRLELDSYVEGIEDVIREYGGDSSRPGMLNYVFSSLISKLYEVNYANINEAIGVLECAKLEAYRRVAAPYEDTKARQNGDVY